MLKQFEANITSVINVETFLPMIVVVILLGPELQCLLKVKLDFSEVLIYQHAILNAK